MKKLRHAFLLGLVLFVIGLGLMWKSVRTIVWKPVNATVASVNERKIFTKSNGPIYAVRDVIYKYDADGKNYSGTILIGRDDKQKVADVISVYYNPEKPSESVIHAGLTFGDLTGILAIPFEMGIVFMITSAVAMCGCCKKNEQAK